MEEIPNLSGEAEMTSVHKSVQPEDRINLAQLEKQLHFKPGEFIELGLTSQDRKLIYNGSLDRPSWTGGKDEILVFLFDHVLLFVKPVKADRYHPIPLGSLQVSNIDETESNTSGLSGLKAAITRAKVHRSSASSSSGTGPTDSTPAPSKNGFPITFTSIGQKGYSVTLWTSTIFGQKRWLDTIRAQCDAINELNQLFGIVPLLETSENKIQCAVLVDNDQRIAYGTSSGFYIADLRQPDQAGVQVDTLWDVAQIEVLEHSNIMLVLSESDLLVFPLEELISPDPSTAQSRKKRIASLISFFKSGVCKDRTLICAVKTSAISSTVKIFEPITPQTLSQHKPALRKLLQSEGNMVKMYKVQFCY
ncbi:hypothetical protein M408DRAFT_26217 [Serendipita vermifera MAFF 305830]|uniref:PH domain-containing protein n=1 Tax=Serendipita vermifera MAFF 305830 TaxID=933852 RepID=A0A0C2X846_SERVB|nr:hypothetical protein M408DRAFT_26217 [Serendipita vermifera MAFF 305830]